ncbi:Aspartyl/glutamyl-tRNA(Asn/Gln) amidotransferase subunit B [Neolewinella maritima]|uniref:Aspartyl/glutamyl-tRNA(Asn/Gln) amidotransferase subunit B n=1 Tax=Neolewinella maritima TaxID=1383882 RepID=A0ABM9B450_9BACT|nr:Asp-tRNA(Asn)/Glu-tRNA(Gln) amidotransferase subunit GatB [Neolewinella maritima]CAH1002014.1 Aspartyl/glutamyl-tRNA(Asn/Gln) amidotransferase subunit B [Neolewinella maritima]
MYETTIGLEAHVQLATASKAFCADRNQYGAAPNEQISIVSLGYPGTLPYLNERQVEYAIRLGLALGCRITRRSTFDRKNYFYADLPKGYQITQDESPICVGGALPVRYTNQQGEEVVRGIKIHHIHMEEDAGKSIHAAGEPCSRVDLNRAGTPLLEIVTEPDLRSAEEVDSFMSGMRQLVRWLDISDGNMEEGSLRCDVNISVRPHGQEAYGTRAEIKNMNSMRYARRAIAHEVERQIGILESGGKVQQQTRQFDPQTGTTSALRTKEDAHDYRYFPDPDLPPVVVTQAYVDQLRTSLGALPWDAHAELLALGVHTEDASLISADRMHHATFLRYAAASAAVPELSKLWVNRILPHLQERPLMISPEQLVDVQRLITDGSVSAANAASRLLPDLLDRPGDPHARAEELGLVQNTDTDFLRQVATEVIAAHPDKAAAYRKGKKGLIGFFMGEVMKRSKGSAEPKETQALLRTLLA